MGPAASRSVGRSVDRSIYLRCRSRHDDTRGNATRVALARDAITCRSEAMSEASGIVFEFCRSGEYHLLECRGPGPHPLPSALLAQLLILLRCLRPSYTARAKGTGAAIAALQRRIVKVESMLAILIVAKLLRVRATMAPMNVSLLT